MGAIEIISVIFALAILGEMIWVLTSKPAPVIKLMKTMFSKTIMPSMAFVVVIIVLGIYLLQELAIAQILAASLFGMMLYGLILIQYPKELINFSKAVLKDKKKAVLPWLLIAAVAVWVLIVVLF